MIRVKPVNADTDAQIARCTQCDVKWKQTRTFRVAIIIHCRLSRPRNVYDRFMVCFLLHSRFEERPSASLTLFIFGRSPRPMLAFRPCDLLGRPRPGAVQRNCRIQRLCEPTQPEHDRRICWPPSGRTRVRMGALGVGSSWWSAPSVELRVMVLFEVVRVPPILPARFPHVHFLRWNGPLRPCRTRKTFRVSVGSAHAPETLQGGRVRRDACSLWATVAGPSIPGRT